jgi:hypothetical protein
MILHNPFQATLHAKSATCGKDLTGLLEVTPLLWNVASV